MPRLARTVFAGIPHHITQRGNRRENVFFAEENRQIYLEWLVEYCRRHEIEILAYCLMTNHIHLVAVPAQDDGLQCALKPLHIRYAQHINRMLRNLQKNLPCGSEAFIEQLEQLASPLFCYPLFYSVIENHC